MEFLTLEEAQKAYEELEEKYNKQQTDLVSIQNLNTTFEKESLKLQEDMEKLRKANMDLWKRLPNFDDSSSIQDEKEVVKVQSWEDFLG